MKKILIRGKKLKLQRKEKIPQASPGCSKAAETVNGRRGLHVEMA